MLKMSKPPGPPPPPPPREGVGVVVRESGAMVVSFPSEPLREGFEPADEEDDEGRSRVDSIEDVE